MTDPRNRATGRDPSYIIAGRMAEGQLDSVRDRDHDRMQFAVLSITQGTDSMTMVVISPRGDRYTFTRINGRWVMDAESLEFVASLLETLYQGNLDLITARAPTTG